MNGHDITDAAMLTHGPPRGGSPVTVRGRNVLLRPPLESDYPTLYAWRVDQAFVALWGTQSRRIPTFRNYVPDLERFLADGITLLVEERKTGALVGLQRAYNVNLADGWAWLQLYFAEGARLQPFKIGEATALFANYLFTMFPMRKLYAEVHAYNTRTLSLVDRLGFEDHGRLPEHVWYDERYWDVLMSSLSREKWLEHKQRFGVLLSVEEEVEMSVVLPSNGIERNGA